MLLDVILVLGSLMTAYGVLKFLAQINDKIIPLLGVLFILVGLGMVFWVRRESGNELSLSDIPDEVFRIIGAFN